MGNVVMTEEMSAFDRIYTADLTYIPDCWKLCGDAHCCNFSRYKSRFKLVLKKAFHELLLLPGEYEFLEAKGWLEQFKPYEHRVIEFPIARGVLRIESITSRKPGCACEHATRPVICRLYPLLPVFDVAGRLTAIERLTIYEEMETIGGLPSACQITALPFEQSNTFLNMTTELGRNVKHLFYLAAYRAAKNHVAKRLAKTRAENNKDIFAIFENAFMRRQLIDQTELRTELDAMAEKFASHYGAQFDLGK